MIRRALAIALLSTGCASLPRPAALVEADRTRTSPASQDAATLAPQAFLAAEKARRDADTALANGDRAGAQLLGEDALAAYEHAVVLARLARADARLAAAKSHADKARVDLGALEEEQRRTAAEADDYDMRLKVARDALPLPSAEPATPERERARLSAAKAIGEQARLLCMATQMLAPDSKTLADSLKALDGLQATLAKQPAHAPIDEAVRLRSSCLSELTSARRPATALAPEAGEPDALLDLLGKAGVEPSRDDRGVVIVLRDLFDGGSLRAASKEKLTALAEIARAHPAFPLLVVAHGARGGRHAAPLADSVAAALKEAGAPKVSSRDAGDVLPVAQPDGPQAAARNERVEIVFVAPTS